MSIMYKLCTCGIQKDQTNPSFSQNLPVLPDYFFMKNLNPSPLFATFQRPHPPLNKGAVPLCRHLGIAFIVNLEHMQSTIQNIKCSYWNFEEFLCGIFFVDCKFFAQDKGQMLPQIEDCRIMLISVNVVCLLLISSGIFLQVQFVCYKQPSATASQK